MPRSAPARPAAPRTPWAGGLAVLLLFSLAGCGLLPGKEPASAEGTMGSRGLELKVAGATVTLPPGAVPVGTKVSIAMDDAGTPALPAPAATPPQDGDPDLLVPVSGRLSVAVAAPLTSALTVALAVRHPDGTEAFNPTAATLALSHTAPDGAEAALTRVGWSGADGGTVSAPQLAGGVFQAVHANIPALLSVAGAAVDQAMASERAPACTDHTVVAAGSLFSVQTPQGTWACVGAAGNLLEVALTSPVPLRVAAAENPDATMRVDGPDTADGSYFHRILQPLAEHHEGLDGTAPGVAATYRTAAAGVENLAWELQPYPALFLLQYLAAVAEGAMDADLQAELGALDASRTAGCVAPLLQSHLDEVDLVDSWALPFTEAFMTCLAGSLPISPRMDVLLGAVNAGPQLLVDTAVERWREQGPEGGPLQVTGQLQWSSYSTTLNQVQVDFSHPAAWTVMDGAVNQQFGQPHTLVVYDHNGHRKGTLTVLDKAPAALPADAQAAGHPVVELGGQVPPGQQTQALLMDLTDQPKVRAANNWSNNVRVVQSLAARGAAVPAQLAPAQLSGSIPAALRTPGQRQRFVAFSHSGDFATVDQAHAYTRTGEYAAIQKMLASFTG